VNEAYLHRCSMSQLMNDISQNKSDFRVQLRKQVARLFQAFQLNTKSDFSRVVELCANAGKTFHDDHDEIFFFCQTLPASGTDGETPIGDSAAIHRAMDPAVRDEFLRKK
jgi:hypothetical protein